MYGKLEKLTGHLLSKPTRQVGVENRDKAYCLLDTAWLTNLPRFQGTQPLRAHVFHLPKNWENSGWDVNGT